MIANIAKAIMLLGVASATTVVWAQSQGGVVRGNTEINVNAQNVNTIAVGSGNTAKTSIGSVKGGTRESSKITVDVKNVSNVVAGRGRKGCINIGTKGADPDCK
ncbi:MAG: hypothetical protein A2040_02685 [Rhodocyclales bacterium GWA2_65_19]|nr:MAG: hypothetical protein A2040_02685 [Rhodocyclales bacterium GWA2_65_19]